MSVAMDIAKGAGKGILKITGVVATAALAGKGASMLSDVPTRKEVMGAALRENNKYHDRRHMK